MEALKKEVLAEFTLEDFVVLYVDVALKLAKEDVSLDYFDWTLRETISNETPLDSGAVKYLHNSFHTSFFNERSSNSPFKLITSRKPWESYIVSLEKNKLFIKKEFVDYILEKHEGSFLARWNNLFRGGFNIFPIPYKNKDSKPNIDLGIVALDDVVFEAFSARERFDNLRIVILGGSDEVAFGLLYKLKCYDPEISVQGGIENHDWKEGEYIIDLDSFT